MKEKEKSKICMLGRTIFFIIVIIDGLFLITEGYINNIYVSVNKSNNILADVGVEKITSIHATNASVITFDGFRESFFLKAMLAVIFISIVIFIVNLFLLRKHRSISLNFKGIDKEHTTRIAG